MDKLFYLTILLILSTYGYVNFEQNKIWKNGETLWSHTLKYYPNSYRVWINRAEYRLGEGRLPEALYDNNKAITLNPYEHEAYVVRSNIFEKANYTEKAQQYFNYAIYLSQIRSGSDILDAIDPSMLVNTLQVLNSTEKLDPQNPKIYLERSKIYSTLQQYDKAQQDLEKYLSINPNNSDVWSTLGEILIVYKQYAKSLNAFNKAIQINPNKLIYYNNRLIACYELGDIQCALADLNFLKSKGFKGINPVYENLINQEK
jgi:tetratricopeptide (TPR) repeat protein